jgi:hypothetical protein
MSANLQHWIYVILVVAIPFSAVHLFPSVGARLISLIWVSALVPAGLGILLFDSGQTVRLKNYSNPAVERRLTLGVRAVVCVLIVLMVWVFTVPIWHGAFDVYVGGQPFTVITGKISSVSTTVLSPGIYWNLHIEKDVDGYSYLFPTVFHFPDKEYEVTLLPSTHFVLDVR